MMSVRADTVAACASAIGALASAVVAIYALAMSKHLEDIAKNQLQATYLSNLYSRQIDAVSALDASTAEAISIAGNSGGVFCIGTENVDKIHSAAGSAAQAGAPLTRQVFERWNVLRYSLPGSFGTFAHGVVDVVQDLQKEVGRFSVAKDPTGDDLKQYCERTRELSSRFNPEREKIFRCVNPIFSAGTPITDENLKGCNFTGAPPLPTKAPSKG